MNVALIIEGLMLGLILLIMALAIYQTIIERNNILKEKLHIEDLKATNQLITTTGNIFELLDNIVVYYVDQYRIINSIEFDKLYITESGQQKMIKDISKQILTEMSPTFYTQLSCFVNKDAIDSIIVNRVSIVVVGVVTEINKMESMKDMKDNRLDKYQSEINKLFNDNDY